MPDNENETESPESPDLQIDHLQSQGHARCPYCFESKKINFIGETSRGVQYKKGTPTKKRFTCGGCNKQFLTESTVLVTLLEGGR